MSAPPQEETVLNLKVFLCRIICRHICIYVQCGVCGVCDVLYNCGSGQCLCAVCNVCDLCEVRTSWLCWLHTISKGIFYALDKLNHKKNTSSSKV